MTTDKRGSTEAAGPTGPRRRRPAPPTIDLQATDVTPPEAAGAAGDAASPEPARPEDAPESETVAAADPAGAAPSAAAETHAEAEAAGDTAAESTDEAEIRSQPAVAPPARARPWLSAIAGAAGGAVVCAAAGAALWNAGLIAPDPGIAARIATLESQVREVAGRSAAGAEDSRALASLATRLAAMEQSLRPLADAPERLARLEANASTNTGPASDPAASSEALRAVDDKLAVLERAIEEIRGAAQAASERADSALTSSRTAAQQAASSASAERGDLDALASRMSAVEQAVKAVESQVTAAAAASGNDRAARFALAVAGLRFAADRGEPFAAELAAVKALTSDPAPLAPLEASAQSGVPTERTLARELAALTGTMLRRAGNTPSEGGFLDRLQANAERLVRVRPVDAVEGSDPAAVISRIEVKAARGDLAGGLAEIEALPPDIRAVAADWSKQAQARLTLDRVLRTVSEQAFRGLAAQAR